MVIFIIKLCFLLKCWGVFECEGDVLHEKVLKGAFHYMLVCKYGHSNHLREAKLNFTDNETVSSQQFSYSLQIKRVCTLFGEKCQTV